ncbi:hypothetical protein Leryth_026083 [Lithospermum erythrorhizon]|nr:hypothetical protein Leryth_026083 [Lithospermum erythrorhizon]
MLRLSVRYRFLNVTLDWWRQRAKTSGCDTFKTVLDGVIFNFVVHPFDAGDQCEIDEKKMIVSVFFQPNFKELWWKMTASKR